jgi:hypothetical protein
MGSVEGRGSESHFSPLTPCPSPLLRPRTQFPKFEMVIDGCASKQHESSRASNSQPQVASDALRNYCDAERHLSQCVCSCFSSQGIQDCVYVRARLVTFCVICAPVTPPPLFHPTKNTHHTHGLNQATRTSNAYQKRSATRTGSPSRSPPYHMN